MNAIFRADDVILRKRGVEFVDGTAPGFAAILGAAPNPEIAAKIATELQEKNLYVFMASKHQGVSFSEQLVEAGVQLGHFPAIAAGLNAYRLVKQGQAGLPVEVGAEEGSR